MDKHSRSFKILSKSLHFNDLLNTNETIRGGLQETENVSVTVDSMTPENKIIVLENVVLSPAKREITNSNEVSNNEDVFENFGRKIPLPPSVQHENNFSDDEIISSSSIEDPYATDSNSSYRPSEEEVYSSCYRDTRKQEKLISSAGEKALSKIRNYNRGQFSSDEILYEENKEISSKEPLPVFVKNTAKEKNIVDHGTDITDDVKEFAARDRKRNTTENMPSEEYQIKNTYKRKPDHCYYCETNVLNFGRHILRNHPSEHEVIEISSKPAKSRERRRLIDILRRKGNYLNQNLKPVRESYIPNQSVLPCDACLGYFSSKLLYRHRKKCSKLPGAAQSAAQSVLSNHIRTDDKLRQEVFPHMRADKISLEAKKDIMICAFGARYLKTHREKHFINVTSRKMRELSKILIELKKLEPAINNLTHALHHKYFDLFVEATKTVAQYDKDKDVYHSPTFAMNIVNSLKTCCDIALTFALKRRDHFAMIPCAEAEADLKTLLRLFTTNWNIEVSNQATNNLNLNKWNKVTIIPLASDLKLLRTYLLQSAERAVKKINRNKQDASAYTMLLESVFCRVILLNRKRPGELQRMLLATYVGSKSKPSYEEFDHTISPTEKILLKKFKRVVIRGKRQRGVPVLFTDDVQEHIKILMEVSPNFVPEQNLYLFGRPKLLTPISGYKVLSKYAVACGAKNPTAISATRLRKHLATITQIFNMNNNEIEQLATFMGHTPGIHKNSYRLPDDIYQTAKISKLLLLMEKGNGGHFKGKSLDEIDVDLEEDISNEYVESEVNDYDTGKDVINELLVNNTNVMEESQPNNSQKLTSKTSKKRKLVPWTFAQKSIVRKFFNKHIKQKKPPKRAECDELLKKYPQELSNKNWLKIKVFIQNEYTKNRKSRRDFHDDSSSE